MTVTRRGALGAAAGALASASTSVRAQQGPIIGMSWANFQEERRKIEETAIKATIERAGGRYFSADAQSNPQKQIADVEALIARGAKAIIILVQDASAIGPAVRVATNERIPLIGYDRLIEDPNAFYLAFDYTEIGRMQARAVFAAKPTGNYVIIKGSSADPNTDFLRQGQGEIIQAAVQSGAIRVVGEAYTDGWLPENAQRNMEQFLTRNNNRVDAVIAANDGTAGGVIAALRAQGLAGQVPVSGQDGDIAALNRIALGTQTVSVWKDVRELGKTGAEIALALARGAAMTAIPNVQRWRSSKGVTMNAMFLPPMPITRENLNVMLDVGWVTKDRLCQGVNPAQLPLCR